MSSTDLTERFEEHCVVNHIAIDELTRSARAVRTTFADIPAEAVEIRSDPKPEALAEVVRRYERHGYAVVAVGGEVTRERHLALGEALSLGEPFIPPLYLRGSVRPGPVSTISAAANASTSEGAHPSFGRSVGQRLHCDGTLQPIGFLKATLMTCREPAADGGVNTLFNSVAAFAELLAADLPAAVALTWPTAMVRAANVNGSDDVNVGPAYTVQNGRLVGYYCATETDSWNIETHPDPEALRRGIAFVERAASLGSPHFRTTELAAAEAILLDNTRLSHGRSAYVDSAEHRRLMLRTLHLSHPRISDCAGQSAARA